MPIQISISISLQTLIYLLILISFFFANLGVVGFFLLNFAKKKPEKPGLSDRLDGIEEFSNKVDRWLPGSNDKAIQMLNLLREGREGPHAYDIDRVAGPKPKNGGKHVN